MRHTSASLFCNDRQQPGDELALAGKNFPAGIGRRKPCRAVDFRKRRPAPALGWPLQLELIRLESRRVEVAFDRPGGDDLAARLDQIPERKKVALRPRAGLLFEFTPRYRQRILALGIFTLGNGPGAPVLLGPERAAGMHEQEFDVGARAPVHEDA